MRTLYLFIVLMVLVAPVSAQSTVTIRTANLQHGQGTDGSFNYQRQIDKLAGADIVVVQERSVSDTGWDIPMSNAGLTQAVFKAHWGSPGDGNAIWVRNTVTVIQPYTFDMANGTNPTSGSSVFGWDGSTDIRRSLCAIKAQVGGKQFYVVSLHLVAASGEDSSNTNFASQRVDQINSALSWINANLPGANVTVPVIIGGDFNLPPNYPRGTERSFTADSTTDALTSSAHGFSNGTAVALRNSGGSAPGGLATGDALYAQATVYYVRDATTNTFKLSAVPGGAAIDLTSNGTGSHFVSATQWDLFQVSYVDLWQEGLRAGKATAPWGDRDADGQPDMPLDFTRTRSHDTRRIDHFVMTRGTSAITLQSISVPDSRATCSVALTSNGAFKECPDVSVLTDTPDDQGVRASDHNFMTVTLNLAATAAISCPSNARVGEVVVCDGSGSTGVNGQAGWSTASFSDGTAPVDLDFGDNQGAYSHSTLLKAPHVYLTAGTYSINLTVKHADGTPVSTSTSIIISDIPAATGGNIQTLTDQGSTSANCLAGQNAINAAFAANTVPQEIRLPNIVYICQWAIPAAAGTSYVTIRPIDTSWLPGPLTRITPASAPNMPEVRSPGVDQIPLMMTGSGRGFLRLLGIEFGKQAGHLYQFIEVGSGTTTYAGLPSNIIIDRCYFRGNPTDDTARAIFVNANKFSLLNSYIDDMHDVGADAQAIAGFAGAAIAFVNNFLHGLGENILFGGADAGIKFQTTASFTTPIEATLSSVANLHVGDGISFTVGGVRGPWTATIVRSIVGNVVGFDPVTNSLGIPSAPDSTSNAVKYGASPQDILIARNHLFKSLSFRVVDPAYNGSYAPVTKNSFELKHAMRVIFDGNVIENMWGNQGQSGPTVLFTPRNQTCYLLSPPNDPVTCPTQDNPWTMVRDVQVTNSRLKNIPNFINILGTDNLNPAGTGQESGPSAFVQYIYVANNLLENIDTAGLLGQIGSLLFVFPGARHVTVTHHTHINVSGGSWLGSTAAPVGVISNDVKVVSNIVEHRDYGIIGDGLQAKDFVNTYFPDGLVTHNVQSDELGTAAPGQWVAPRSAPNYFPATINTNTFINMGAGNFRLKSDSPYKAGNATPAADGRDIGVNVDDVTAATLNTISGHWTTNGRACRWHTTPSCN